MKQYTHAIRALEEAITEAAGQIAYFTERGLQTRAERWEEKLNDYDAAAKVLRLAQYDAEHNATPEE